MKRALPFIIVGAVLFILCGSLVMLYRAKRLPTPTAATGEENLAGLHVRGEARAPVTLEEFGDFQCPPCGRVAKDLKEIEKDYGSRLRVIFHQFPLDMHAHAREAAFASEAADRQHRFWEMHDMLYQEQETWSKAADVPALFREYAGKIGLDLERFEKDIKDPEVAAKVDADQKVGLARGVASTPTLFINKTLVPATSLNSTAVRQAIDEALKEKPKP
ncbi:MAG TPA: thioredoxin domain-containing protein [Chthoniobacterales bacterium]|nr:thioredoxin domain-containing protein [Chthoniobacterales bacterium]